MLQSTRPSDKALPPHRFTTTKIIYLLLTIFGSTAPWFLLLQNTTNLSLSWFFQKALANNIASGLATDLLISATVFFCFSYTELKRLGVSRRWMAVYVGLTFLVGLSCTLPLFLYLREQILEQGKSKLFVI